MDRLEKDDYIASSLNTETNAIDINVLTQEELDEEQKEMEKEEICRMAKIQHLLPDLLTKPGESLYEYAQRNKDSMDEKTYGGLCRLLKITIRDTHNTFMPKLIKSVQHTIEKKYIYPVFGINDKHKEILCERAWQRLLTRYREWGSIRKFFAGLWFKYTKHECTDGCLVKGKNLI